MANEEMKNVETKEMVEETTKDEELKKLMDQVNSLMKIIEKEANVASDQKEPETKPATTEKKEDEKPKGFFGRIGYYCTHTSLRDAASDAGKVLLGGGAIAAAVFGGKYLYDSRKRDQLPEKYVPSEVVDTTDPM